MEFAIHLLLADAAGDQLGNLGAEIEDEDFLVSHLQSLESTRAAGAALWATGSVSSTW